MTMTSEQTVDRRQDISTKDCIMKKTLSPHDRSAAFDRDIPNPARIQRALEELRRGRMVLVVDDEDRENEGDLIMAAELANPEALAFMIRHTSGIICVGITDERAAELDLPHMVSNPDDPRGTAFTVSVDARGATTTGVSSADR